MNTEDENQTSLNSYDSQVKHAISTLKLIAQYAALIVFIIAVAIFGTFLHAHLYGYVLKLTGFIK